MIRVSVTVVCSRCGETQDVPVGFDRAPAADRRIERFSGVACSSCGELDMDTARLLPPASNKSQKRRKIEQAEFRRFRADPRQ